MRINSACGDGEGRGVRATPAGCRIEDCYRGCAGCGNVTRQNLSTELTAATKSGRPVAAVPAHDRAAHKILAIYQQLTSYERIRRLFSFGGAAWTERIDRRHGVRAAGDGEVHRLRGTPAGRRVGHRYGQRAR